MPDPDLETQYVIEDLYNKNQTLPRIREIFHRTDVYAQAERCDIDKDFAVDFLAQVALRKRVKPEALIGLLKHHFEEVADTEAEKTRAASTGAAAQPVRAQLQACAGAVSRALVGGFAFWDRNRKEVIVRFDIPAEVQEDLDRYQYPLPLVIPPREVTKNTQTGYHSDGSRRGSIILKKNHHNDDVCLDHINRMNRVKLQVNYEIARLIQNQWRHLDHKKADETYDDFRKRVKAFERYNTSTRDVLDFLAVTAPDGFYLTHRYDKRGRTYAQGYHVNPQGSDWNKACIEFADREIITD